MRSDARPTGGPSSTLIAAVLALALAGCKGGTDGPGATSLDPPAGPEPPEEAPAFPFTEHVDQARIADGDILFDELFVLGDELFEVEFNALDGVGALRLPDGSPLPGRFSRLPPGGGRRTGPNGQACGACHASPFPTSAGEAASNVLQDPRRDGVGPFNVRNAISLFGAGVVQRVAEELSEALQTIRDDAASRAVAGGPGIRAALEVQGISFGEIIATRAVGGEVEIDTAGVVGVDPDLVVRPFGWKGDVTTLRDFCRGAARGEMGLEPDELVMKDGAGDGLDPDGDGVTGELSVGDVTAITVYVAAQEVPVEAGRIARLGLGEPLDRERAALAERGEALFQEIGCAACHVREVRLADPVFREPSLAAGGAYLDADLDPEATRLDPATPFELDLVQEGDPPRLEPHSDGGAIVRAWSDFRRHAMGRRLADAQPTPVTDARGRPLVIDGAPVVVPEDVFLTPELWGVGNTGPWLHDGRAGSLAEAIDLHGEDAPPALGEPGRSEAQKSRDAFLALDEDDRVAVTTFLRTLLLIDLESGE